jgi:hypothetical protein
MEDELYSSGSNFIIFAESIKKETTMQNDATSRKLPTPRNSLSESNASVLSRIQKNRDELLKSKKKSKKSHK